MRETATATGTGVLTLNGAEPGFVSFHSVFSTTQTFEYEISGSETGNFETGVGVMLDAHTLQRNSVIKTHPGGGDTFVDFTEETKVVTGKITGFRQSQIVEQVVRWPVWNASGGTLTKMTAVCSNGRDGTSGLPLIIAADKDAGATRPAIGLVESDISNNSAGYIVQHGIIDNANTSAWNDRDLLFLGDAGGITTTAPTTGHLQYLGSVVYDHATDGIVLVAIGTTLASLLALAGEQTMLGAILMGNKNLTGLKNSGLNGVYNAGDKTGSSQTLDWNNGNFQHIRLTGNVTGFTWTAPPGVTTGLVLEIEQDGTGSRTCVTPSDASFGATGNPELSTTAGKVDKWCGQWNGTGYSLGFFKSA